MRAVVIAITGVLLALCFSQAKAGEVRIAVASNFQAVLQKLVVEFERSSGHTASVSAGSSGKHYAQIRLGAPFDVFLAADAQRPQKLLAQGIGDPQSLVTYALGRLALWHPKSDSQQSAARALHTAYEHLAIANPKLAPYGQAAEQVLSNLGVLSSAQPRLVMGENVAQVFQFVASGNAELGLVAVSQLLLAQHEVGHGVWQIPKTLYAPIEQHALLINPTPAAEAFMQFLMGQEAQTLIMKSGYDTVQ